VPDDHRGRLQVRGLSIADPLRSFTLWFGGVRQILWPDMVGIRNRLVHAYLAKDALGDLDSVETEVLGDVTDDCRRGAG
jgi:hypothetical protein